MILFCIGNGFIKTRRLPDHHSLTEIFAETIWRYDIMLFVLSNGQWPLLPLNTHDTNEVLYTIADKSLSRVSLLLESDVPKQASFR